MKDHKLESRPFDINDLTPDEAVLAIQKAAKGLTNSVISSDGHIGDYGCPGHQVEGWRPMTDKELEKQAARRKKDREAAKRREEQARERRRQEYERLRKEFE